ncbi:MAG: DUF2937 family protein [Opitutales bacterium]
MKLRRQVFEAGDTLIDRTLCVLGAVLFSQAPEFMQQYLQRLGGHLDEARRQLAHFQQVAAQAGITLDRLISQTSASPEPTVAKLGGVISETTARVDTLAAAQSALQDASLWTRPFVFLRHLDPAIAHATWSIFKPAVPTTAEGLVYALAGMLVLLGVYHLALKRPVVRWIDGRPAAPPAVPPAAPLPGP